jgi:hypothetical protein
VAPLISLSVKSPKDFSTNGFTLNGYDVRRSSVLLMDGDVMEFPSSRSGKSPIMWDTRINANLSITRIQVHTSTLTMQRKDFHF